jgi:hypothetical protein
VSSADDGTEAGAGPSDDRMLDVDGERFRVRIAERGGYHYDWLSGPNASYGISISGPAASDDVHVARIRQFLGSIDPATGYLAE